jgi:hypothetical protein
VTLKFREGVTQSLIIRCYGEVHLGILGVPPTIFQHRTVRSGQDILHTLLVFFPHIPVFTRIPEFTKTPPPPFVHTVTHRRPREAVRFFRTEGLFKKCRSIFCTDFSDLFALQQPLRAHHVTLRHHVVLSQASATRCC